MQAFKTPSFFTRATWALGLLAASAAVLAEPPAVTDLWVRGTVAQQKATGAFMQLRSAQGSRLVSVATPLAGMAEVHEMKMVGDVMKMGEVAGGLELPAGKAVKLQPGGFHVMLMDLKQPLKAGDQVPLTLTFKNADGKTEQLTVQAPVRALGASAPGPALEH
ncbi:copper chaperone PCu(A)C [Ideonella azotifigens]|uniref:Copper chaperone PCu(A)C n=1 Tax=Ideonella azotifigens TaxID=513160 RepID=A0ABN1KL82_9BURK|nr:copper chaperone PCu(A)C [Ideonella azotifigens]MCD2344793.1 copper chaperone PCu(A)C [Ideonella azotifigens]